MRKTTFTITCDACGKAIASVADVGMFEFRLRVPSRAGDAWNGADYYNTGDLCVTCMKKIKNKMHKVFDND